MKKAKVKALTQRRPSTANLKVLSFYAAVLVVITALIGLYIAWAELNTPGSTDELLI